MSTNSSDAQRNEGLTPLANNPEGNISNQTVEFLPSVPASKPSAIQPMVGSTPGLGDVAKALDATVGIVNDLKSGNIGGAAGKLAGATAEALAGDAVSILNSAKALTEALGVGGGGGSTKIDDINISAPPPGGGDFGDPSSSASSSVNRLSIAAHPVEIRYRTNIPTDGYTPEWEVSETGYAYPHWANSCLFQLPGNSINSYYTSVSANYFVPSAVGGTNIQNFVTNSLFQDLILLIQRNVNFSISSLVSSTTLLTAFNALLFVLQIYFAASRYAVTATQPMNKNEAIKALGNSFTATDELNFIQLQRTLSAIPKPPRLVEYTYYLMQLYRTGETPKSPFVSLNPFPINGSGLPDWGIIPKANQALVDNLSTFSVVGKAVPAWYATGLPTGAAAPLHDPSFLTIFTNSPVGYKNATYDFVYPVATATSTSWSYNTYTDELDASAYSLASSASLSTTTTAALWYPGLLLPVFQPLSTGLLGNRYTWWSSSYVDCYVNDLAFMRDDTYTLSSRFNAATNATLPVGTQRVKGVCVDSVSNTAVKLLDHLFDVTSIAVKVEKSISGKNNLRTSDSFSPKPPNTKRSKSKFNKNKKK